MPKQMVGSAEVHTFPLPPKGFDPLTASPQELVRHGFPQRPDPVETPVLAGKWVSAFRRYREFNHITPEFKGLGHLHSSPKRQSEKGTVGAFNGSGVGSLDAAGAQLSLYRTGDSFKWIVGSWTVPNCYPTPGFAGTESCWVSLSITDGLQVAMYAGTGTTIESYFPYNYAWFEWSSNIFQGDKYATRISNFAVNPGDVIFLLLCLNTPTMAGISIANMASQVYTNFSFSAPQGSQLIGNFAGAWVHRPMTELTLVQLPRYGAVFFDDTLAVSAKTSATSPFGTAQDIGLGTRFFMVADDGVTVISVPTFEADTDAFKVSYTGP